MKAYRAGFNDALNLMIGAALIMVGCLVASTAFGAEAMERCTDANGKVTYTNDPKVKEGKTCKALTASKISITKGDAKK